MAELTNVDGDGGEDVYGCSWRDVVSSEQVVWSIQCEKSVLSPLALRRWVLAASDCDSDHPEISDLASARTLLTALLGIDDVAL